MIGTFTKRSGLTPLTAEQLQALYPELSEILEPRDIEADIAPGYSSMWSGIRTWFSRGEPADPDTRPTFPSRALNADNHRADWAAVLHSQEPR